jgi:hypothetical protein
MLEVAINVDRQITATEVPEGERFSYLLRRFGRHHTTVELFLRSFAVELCVDFKGAQWRYFETSTGSVFMVPSGYESLLVSIEANGFEARVSAEVAGLILSLYVLARLCDVSRRSQEHMRMLVLLRNYALQHPMATTIFRAID